MIRLISPSPACNTTSCTSQRTLFLSPGRELATNFFQKLGAKAKGRNERETHFERTCAQIADCYFAAKFPRKDSFSTAMGLPAPHNTRLAKRFWEKSFFEVTVKQHSYSFSLPQQEAELLLWSFEPTTLTSKKQGVGSSFDLNAPKAGWKDSPSSLQRFLKGKKCGAVNKEIRTTMRSNKATQLFFTAPF